MGRIETHSLSLISLSRSRKPMDRWARGGNGMHTMIPQLADAGG